MSDNLKERIREIEESARKVDKLAGKLATKTLERKFLKEEWEAAVERHMELCRNWEDSEEVEDRPLIRAVEGRDETKADPVSVDLSWREEPIEVLQAFGLDANTVEWLNRDGLSTLGALNDRGQKMGANSGPIFEAIEAYFDARAADVQDVDDDEDDTDATEDAEAVSDEADPPEPWESATEEDVEAALAAADEAGAGALESNDEWPGQMLEETDVERKRSGLDLVTSHPGSDPESNGVEGRYGDIDARSKAEWDSVAKPAKPKRRKKAKA